MESVCLLDRLAHTGRNLVVEGLIELERSQQLRQFDILAGDAGRVQHPKELQTLFQGEPFYQWIKGVVATVSHGRSS